MKNNSQNFVSSNYKWGLEILQILYFSNHLAVILFFICICYNVLIIIVRCEKLDSMQNMAISVFTEIISVGNCFWRFLLKRCQNCSK